MTPAARVNAAITVMDRILAGELADRVLADWGRKNRYAGSKDRAAIGDIVYDILRQKLSMASLGGGETGRALLLGYVRARGEEPSAVFGADRYAPHALTAEELERFRCDGISEDVNPDMPEWLWPDLLRSHGDKARDIARSMRERAPVHLRANLIKQSRTKVIDLLAEEDVIATPQTLSPSALEVVAGARKIRNSFAYKNGHIELQDASSQAVADMVPLAPRQKLLDFCAGGGGKVLAVAGRVAGVFFAHDIDPHRMKDLPARATRAGVRIEQVPSAQLEAKPAFDTVLVDAPCSGSGSWRRDPQGKWLLTPDILKRVVETQKDVLDHAASLVRPGGHLVYATCSLLDLENERQVHAFLARNSFYYLVEEQHFTPLSGGDGFYAAILRRA